MATVKITNAMRRMVKDREYAEAIAALVHADDVMREAKAKLSILNAKDRDARHFAGLERQGNRVYNGKAPRLD